MSNDKSQNLPKTERTSEKWYEAKMGNDHQGLIVDEATGETIAVTYKKENAAFIVKACNLHDELVDALTWLVRCADPNDDDEGFNNWKIQDIEHAVNRAKDLIAKAQEV